MKMPQPRLVWQRAGNRPRTRATATSYPQRRMYKTRCRLRVHENSVIETRGRCMSSRAVCSLSSWQASIRLRSVLLGMLQVCHGCLRRGRLVWARGEARVPGVITPQPALRTLRAPSCHRCLGDHLPSPATQQERRARRASVFDRSSTLSLACRGHWCRGQPTRCAAPSRRRHPTSPTASAWTRQDGPSRPTSSPPGHPWPACHRRRAASSTPSRPSRGPR